MIIFFSFLWEATEETKVRFQIASEQATLMGNEVQRQDQ